MPTLADQKSRCRRAFQLARKAAPGSAILFSRLYSDTLAMADGETDEVAAEMFRRCSVQLECAADRTQWPESVRGFVKRIAREQRRDACLPNRD